MTIAFVHPHLAFLPELEAYTRFFSARNYTVEVVPEEKLPVMHTEVEWHFMGLDLHPHKPGRIKIHEYSSASVPPFQQIKNLYKKFRNAKPAYRLFLNSYIQGKMNLNDNVPFGYRDMGIYPSEYPALNLTKEYDFIYAGSVSKERKIQELLNLFTQDHLRDKILLILSRDYLIYQKKYAAFSNIQFAGPVSHSAVNTYLQKSRFALNFLPDAEPFNRQTSTKFLEYAAAHIPVISTGYSWVRNFQQQYGGNYYFLQPDLSNFNWEMICNYPYAFPDLSKWSWEEQILKSGVVQFLEENKRLR